MEETTKYENVPHSAKNATNARREITLLKCVEQKQSKLAYQTRESKRLEQNRTMTLFVIVIETVEILESQTVNDTEALAVINIFNEKVRVKF